MKTIWNFLVHGYVPLRCDKHRSRKISIKLLILLIGAIIAYKYYLIQEDKNMIDWIKNEVEELKDWVVSGTVVDVKVWWVIAAWVLWKYVIG